MKPKETVERGRQIYNEKLKAVLEKDALGKYVVIDVKTERHFLGDTPDGTLRRAKEELPDGVFLLIRVGYKGVSRLTTMFL
jgi:hypothetical protein